MNNANNAEAITGWERSRFAKSDLVATLADGRRMRVSMQYSDVRPLGEHGDACWQVATMGGRCDCGLLDGVDVEALILAGRAEWKKIHDAERAAAVAKHAVIFGALCNAPKDDVANGLCPRCHTYCMGDCQAD
jgi:hypothetical protein